MVITTHNIKFHGEMTKTIQSPYLLFKPHHEKICLVYICEKKGTDQLFGSSVADQCLCFHNIVHR